MHNYALRLVSYSLCITTFGFTLFNDLTLYTTVPKLINVSITFPRHAFLTHWTIWIQLFYYFFGFWALVFRSSRLINFMDTLRKIVYAVRMFACATFWIIFSIDRELIYPSYYDELVPAYQNHLWHTLPAILQCCDMLFFKHSIPSMTRNLLIMAVFFVIYFGRCYLFFVQKSIWPYSFMTHMWAAGELYFGVLIVMFFFLIVIFMYSGNAIHRMVYRKKKDIKKNK